MILSLKYVNSLTASDEGVPVAPSPVPNSLEQAQEHPHNERDEAQPAGLAPAPRRNQEFAQEPQGDREDDWLGILHNTVSFIILFTIIYYYSSFERFFVICLIVFFLFL